MSSSIISVSSESDYEILSNQSLPSDVERALTEHYGRINARRVLPSAAVTTGAPATANPEQTPATSSGVMDIATGSGTGLTVVDVIDDQHPRRQRHPMACRCHCQ